MPARKSNASSIGAPADAEEGTTSGPLTTSTTTALAATPAKERDGINIEDLSLPRTMIQRLAKGVLPPNTQIQKDAVLALQKSATVFVNYLASQANAATQASNRRTIPPQAILDALEECEFSTFMPRVEAELKRFSEMQTTKRNDYRKKVKDREGGNATNDATEVSTIGGEQDANDHSHIFENTSMFTADGEMNGNQTSVHGETDNGDIVSQRSEQNQKKRPRLSHDGDREDTDDEMTNDLEDHRRQDDTRLQNNKGGERGNGNAALDDDATEVEESSSENGHISNDEEDAETDRDEEEDEEEDEDDVADEANDQDSAAYINQNLNAIDEMDLEPEQGRHSHDTKVLAGRRGEAAVIVDDDDDDDDADDENAPHQQVTLGRAYHRQLDAAEDDDHDKNDDDEVMA